MKRPQGGLVFKAHRLLYHSTLGFRVVQKAGELQRLLLLGRRLRAPLWLSLRAYRPTPLSGIGGAHETVKAFFRRPKYVDPFTLFPLHSEAGCTSATHYLERVSRQIIPSVFPFGVAAAAAWATQLATDAFVVGSSPPCSCLACMKPSMSLRYRRGNGFVGSGVLKEFLGTPLCGRRTI